MAVLKRRPIHLTIDFLFKPENSSFASAPVFVDLTEKLEKNPDIAKKINAVYVFSIKKGNDENVKTWSMNFMKKYFVTTKISIKLYCVVQKKSKIVDITE